MGLHTSYFTHNNNNIFYTQYGTAVITDALTMSCYAIAALKNYFVEQKKFICSNNVWYFCVYMCVIKRDNGKS